MEWVRAHAVGQADGFTRIPEAATVGRKVRCALAMALPQRRTWPSASHAPPGAFVREGINKLQGKRVPGEESTTIVVRSEGTTMLGELINIPTDTLFDMVFILLAGGRALTSCEVAELEKIQRELQRRGEIERWDC
jgi:hypothetical protein